MKFEDEPINEELEAECWHEGIIANYKKLTREQALVLLGEKMLENLLKFWRRELFPNCLLKNMAASDEEMRKMLGSDKADVDDEGEKCEGGKAENYEKEASECSTQHEDIQSSLTNCKGVMRMDESTKEKVADYLEVFNEIKQKTGDSTVAIALLSEICKDRRMQEIKEQKEANNNEPATSKQKRFMDDLGIKYPKTVTKKEASMLIEEEIGKNGE